MRRIRVRFVTTCKLYINYFRFFPSLVIRLKLVYVNRSYVIRIPVIVCLSFVVNVFLYSFGQN